MCSLGQSSFALLVALCIVPAGCRRQRDTRIAVIPRTTGTMLWEPLHNGVETAAHSLGIKIYWNAPTRQDDISGQVALIERLTGQGKYQGFVIAPDQSLALIAPVKRALAKGIPIVIVGSPLLTQPGGKLFYVINDEEEAGRIAARRLGTLLHGKGTVALLGINPDIAGTMQRARSFEMFLASNYPDIHVIDKRLGSFNVPHEQQVAEEILRANPHLDAVIAITNFTTQGVISTIDNNPAYSGIKVIGFDPDSLDLRSPALDSLVIENMPQMGEEAIHLLHDVQDGKRVSSQMDVEPMLVTRDNAQSDEVRRLTSMDFQPWQHRDWMSR